MGKNPKDIVLAIVDYGTFTYFAERLSDHFKKVILTNPRSGPFPETDRDDIGTGINGFTKYSWPDFWEHIDEIDMLWFPFINDGCMAEDFRKRGKLVVSTGKGEILERDRDLFKNTLADLHLPVVPYKNYTRGKTVYGWDDLRAEMQRNENFWVKMSDFRGIGETHHVKNYNESEHWLFELGHILKGQRKTFPFHLEDHIDAEEIGDDLWFNGKSFLSKGLFGREAKDSGYLCRVVEYDNIPEIIKNIHDTMIPTFQKYGIKSPVSTEMRVTDKNTAYWTDATQRVGSPPGEIICEIWTNLPEMLVALAEGEDIEPETDGDNIYGASVFLYSERVKSELTNVVIPKSIRRWVKLQNYFERDGACICIPQDGGSCLGAAIGLGSTAEEAEINALETADQVKADGIYYSENVFDKIDESIQKARKIGVWVD